jgi:integrase
MGVTGRTPMATKLATEPTTGKMINALSPGVFKTLDKIKPSGALQVRKQTNGAVAFYWRYSIGSVSERVPIGVYDPSAPPKSLTPTARGHSVAAAIRAAEELALQHHAHRELGGRPALLAAQTEARRDAAASKKEAEKHTLQALLADYCDHLQALGRVAHRDARSIFKLHIIEAWPEVAHQPANRITAEQVADMMRVVIEKGKGRTANKLRSYIRAAFQTAKAARSKPSIPVHFKAYAVTANPAAETEPDESANKADKNPLSGADLRRYWSAIKPLPGLRGAVLRLHLLTGGQRIEQLVNLRTGNVSGDVIVLHDGKGRPGKPPRPHTVPLLPLAAAALLECNSKGIFAISTDQGKTHLAATTLSAWAAEAANGITDFQAKRIRSGIETLLASLGVSKEVRGRLQSHGVSGVQARHYDAHDYLPEKRKALEAMLEALEHKQADNVTPIHRGPRVKQVEGVAP